MSLWVSVTPPHHRNRTTYKKKSSPKPSTSIRFSFHLIFLFPLDPVDDEGITANGRRSRRNESGWGGTPLSQVTRKTSSSGSISGFINYRYGHEQMVVIQWTNPFINEASAAESDGSGSSCLRKRTEDWRWRATHSTAAALLLFFFRREKHKRTHPLSRTAHRLVNRCLG